MKHKVTFEVVTQKKNLFGISRPVKEKRTVEVDGKTYRKIKNKVKQEIKAERNKPYTIEEMLFYDDLFGD